MKETRATAATVNFMADLEHRVWTSSSRTKGNGFNVSSTTRSHLANSLKLRLISRLPPIRIQGRTKSKNSQATVWKSIAARSHESP